MTADKQIYRWAGGGLVKSAVLRRTDVGGLRIVTKVGGQMRPKYLSCGWCVYCRMVHCQVIGAGAFMVDNAGMKRKVRDGSGVPARRTSR
ncbi:hypothetical protein KCP74_24465 [Salmonella enterica subsp. enterica]|nr:hypothetical protein KCP74_24465 [Salmonella enterica subsp. enterica]